MFYLKMQLNAFSKSVLGKLSNIKSGKVWKFSQGEEGVTDLEAKFPTFRLEIFQSEGVSEVRFTPLIWACQSENNESKVRLPA